MLLQEEQDFNIGIHFVVAFITSEASSGYQLALTSSQITVKVRLQSHPRCFRFSLRVWPAAALNWAKVEHA